MADKNMGASVRAKLKNKAQAEGKEFNLILTRYALERLLYRLSISDYRDRFLLKGHCYLICSSTPLKSNKGY